jgi:predicted nucleic acid-binding protein
VAEKPVYVLDTFALLVYLQNETGTERVMELLQSAQKERCHVCLCIINLGEVLYIVERRRGLTEAQAVLAVIQQTPIEILPADEQTVLAAAHIKANHKLSYADAFTVACAQRLEGSVLTGDKEFETVESLVTLEWLEA